MLSQEALSHYLETGDLGMTIGPRPTDALVPLSFGQEQVWLHASLAPDLPLYNETITIKYCAKLNCGALEESLNEVVRRHEAWRTSITVVDGEPFQSVVAAQPIPFSHIDLTSMTEGLREAEAIRLATESAVRLFDLETGPLLRALAVTLRENDHRLYLTLHHLIFDGASMRQVFLPELVSLYSHFAHGESTVCLPKLDLQYGDFAYWQRLTRAGAAEASVSYWRAQLADSPVLSLPTDQPRSAILSFRGAGRTFQLSESLTSSLKKCSAREHVTLFTTLFASFTLLLGRLCQQEDIAVGVPLAAKAHPEVEPLLGYFLNTVVLRTDLSGNPEVRELLQRVQEVTIAALSHAEVPLQSIVRDLHPSRHGSNPFFQTLFSVAPPMTELPPEWAVSEVDVSSGTAKEELDVELDDRGSRIVGRILYKADLFNPSTIDRLVDYWIIILTAIAEDTSRRISDLPLMSGEEHGWLIRNLNETKRQYPAACIHELISERASLAPDAIAVHCRGQELTYRELDARANQLAHHLCTRGASPGSLVGLCVNRSMEMVISLVAILKTGAAYVPLDPKYPTERLASMLLASGAGLLVSDYSVTPRFHPSNVQVVYLDSDSEEISRQSRHAPVSISNHDDPAYVIFTSGSTGEPKGVEISHRSLTNLLWSMKQQPGITSEDTLLCVTSMCFDIAALEIFLPLLVGAKLVVAVSEELADPLLLMALLDNCQATIMQATPVTWRLLIEAGWSGSDRLTIFCGGEALTQPLAAALIQRSRALWNMYGPTETTIWSSCEQITSSESFAPLGRPIANTTLYVLDERKRLAPTGVHGELYIGGDGLAKGYWGQPELTSQRFLMVSLPDGSVTRLYKTGDRVRRHADGSLEFLGRLDKQVKIRGFRIELAEIEQALNRFPGVQDAVVIKSQSGDDEGVLVAYVLAQQNGSWSVRDLRTHLERVLPFYMLPSTIHIVDKMPTTLNGKVDQKKLPASSSHHLVTEFQSPLTEIETELAKLWCQLLDIDAVGRDDNFFDLGGHSSLVGRLIARVKSRFGKRIAVTMFIQTPTIAHLARLLSGNDIPHLAVVKKGSSKRTPLIWVGPAPWQHRLSSYLSPEQPVMSVLLSQSEITSTAPEYRLEDLAACMVTKIRQLYPDAAYAIAGFCQTSLLAYECAKSLLKLGHEVPLLVMGDVLPPGYLQRLSFVERSKRRLEREAFYLSAIGHSLPSHWKLLLKRRMGGLRVMREEIKWAKFYRSGSKDSESVQELYPALLVGQLRYIPSRYPGRVLFLQSGNRPPSARWDAAATWEGLLDDQEIFESPADHTDIFEEPHIKNVAERIQLALDGALDNELCASNVLA
jgi:amino acid adenylation domain-containing protein